MATLSAFSSPCPSWPNPNPNPNSDLSDHKEQSERTEPACVVFPANPVPIQNVNPKVRDGRLSPSSSVPTLLHTSFNHDYGCFTMGTDRGFRVYTCDPFHEMFRRDFDRGGGIGFVEMRSAYSFIALVGGGSNPHYPLNKVMIWDNHESRCISELSFRTQVRAVRLPVNRIVVVVEHKVFMYNSEDLRLLHQMETISNQKGLCAVSQVPESIVLVCPGLQKGQVRVEHYAPSRRSKFIMAHESRIASIALTMDGQLLATASSKGTLVRIFNTMDGVLLQEVRRGADRAEIYSMAFSSNSHWLAVSSNKGTVHVFSLKVNLASPGNGNSDGASNSNPVVALSSSSLSFMKGVLPKYFRSEWSVAQFRLPEGSQYIVAFGHQKNTVVIIGVDGSFYRCQFDPSNGGDMIQLEYHNFLKPENDKQ